MFDIRHAWAGLVMVGVAGCSRDEVPYLPPPPPAETTAVAPDELAPGELAEGPHTAFGLAIPALMQLEVSNGNAVRARGRVKPEAVATYLRARLDASQVITGPAKTIFDDAKVKVPRGPSTPADAGPVEEMILRYEVGQKDGVTTLLCARERRVHAPANLTEDQRWERLGLRKDGKPLDPKKFE